MTSWPAFSKLPDQKSWIEQKEDPSIQTAIAGGYMMTRARYTRAPRQYFRMEYKDLTNADKALWDAFWNTVQGGSDVFTFTHPFTGVSYQMRFTQERNGEPPICTYQNYHVTPEGAPDHRWMITEIELLEA